MKRSLGLIIVFFAFRFFAMGQDLNYEQIRLDAGQDSFYLRQVILDELAKNGSAKIDFFLIEDDIKSNLIVQLLLPTLKDFQNEIDFNLTLFQSSPFDANVKNLNEQGQLRYLAIRELYPDKHFEYLTELTESQNDQEWLSLVQEFSFDLNKVEQTMHKSEYHFELERIRNDINSQNSLAHNQLRINEIILNIDFPFQSSGINNISCCSYEECLTNCLEEDLDFPLDPTLVTFVIAKCRNLIAVSSTTAIPPIIISAVTCADALTDLALFAFSDVIYCDQLCKVNTCQFNSTSELPCDEDENEFCFSNLEWQNYELVPTTECLDCPTVELFPNEFKIRYDDKIIEANDGSPVGCIWSIRNIRTDEIYYGEGEAIDGNITVHFAQFLDFQLHDEIEVIVIWTGAAIVCDLFQNTIYYFCPEISIQVPEEDNTITIRHKVPEPFLWFSMYVYIKKDGTVVHSEYLDHNNYQEFQFVAEEIGEYCVEREIYYNTVGIEDKCYTTECFNIEYCDLPPNQPNFTFQFENESAPGANDGFLRAVNIQGQEPYQYLWYHLGFTDSSEISIGSGTYCLRIIDANGCKSDFDFSRRCIKLEPENCVNRSATCDDFRLDSIITNSSYPNINDGSITIENIDGLTLYYYWDDIPGSTMEGNRMDLLPGEYCVEIYDKECCYERHCFTVESDCNTELELIVEPACDENGGSITVNPTGGNPPYKYEWNTGGGSQIQPFYDSDTYSVTVTDAKGCIATADQKISVEQPLTLDYDKEILCDSKFNVKLYASGGIEPYAYTWDDGSLDQARENLPPGQYWVTATDAQGCEIVEKITQEFIQGALSATLDMTPACPRTPSGAASAKVSGGVPQYSYKWNTGSSQSYITDLWPGEYSVTITDTDGCFTVESIEVTAVTIPLYVLGTNPSEGEVSIYFIDPAPFAITWTGPGVTAANEHDMTLTDMPEGTYCVSFITDTKVVCSISECIELFTELEVEVEVVNLCQEPSGPDPSICLTVSGGSGDYSIEWLGSTGNDNCYPDEIELDNIYCYSVVDNINGTSVFDCVAYPTYAEPEIVETSNFQPCPNDFGYICVEAIGNFPPYSLTWQIPVPGSPNCGAFLPGEAQNLVVTDGCGQSYTHELTLAPIANIEILDAIIVHDEVNNGFCAVPDGSIDLILSVPDAQATGSISYRWYDADGNLVSINQDIYNLEGGIYRVEIRQCGELVAEATYVINDYDGEGFDITAFTLRNACINESNGKVWFKLEGNFYPPFTFKIYEVLSGNLVSSSGSPGHSNLPKGDYYVVAYDNYDCQKSASFSIGEIPELEVSSTVTPECIGDDGSIELHFDNLDQVKVEYLSWIGQNENGTILSDVSAGTYEVWIRYTEVGNTTNPMTYCSWYVYTVEVPQSPFHVEAAIDNICFSEAGDAGAIDLTVTGGLPPYTFDWKKENDNSFHETTEDITHLASGDYFVTVTDANGCLFEKEYFVRGSIKVSIDIVPSCYNDYTGSIALDASASDELPVSFEWNNGETTPSIENLPPGIYFATLTDAENCTATLERTVNQIDIDLSYEVINACTNNNGSISLDIQNPSQYTFNWSNGSTQTSLTDLTAGAYTVTVSEASGCQRVEKILVGNDGIDISILELNGVSYCYNNLTEGDGHIEVEGQNGLAPYSYFWSTGANTSSISNLSPGQYSVTVTDARGCTGTLSRLLGCCNTETIDLMGNEIILSYEEFTVSPSISPLSGPGSMDGGIELTISGDGNYNDLIFHWEDGNGNYLGGNEQLNGLGHGNYHVTITGPCQTYTNWWPIRHCDGLVWNVDIHKRNPCKWPGWALDPIPGFIELDHSPDETSAPYDYEWYPFNSGNPIDVLSINWHSVTITDRGGCTTEIPNISIYNGGQIIEDPLTCELNAYCNGSFVKSFGDGGREPELQFANNPYDNEPCRGYWSCGGGGGELLTGNRKDKKVVGFAGDGECMFIYLCEFRAEDGTLLDTQWTEFAYQGSCCDEEEGEVVVFQGAEDCNEFSSGVECYTSYRCSNVSEPFFEKCNDVFIELISTDPCKGTIVCGDSTGVEIDAIATEYQYLDVLGSGKCLVVRRCQFQVYGQKIWVQSEVTEVIDCCTGTQQLGSYVSAANCNPNDEDVECLVTYYCFYDEFSIPNFLFSECLEQGQDGYQCQPEEECNLEVSLNDGGITSIACAEVSGGSGSYIYDWSIFDIVTGATISSLEDHNDCLSYDDPYGTPPPFVLCVKVRDADLFIGDACLEETDCMVYDPLRGLIDPNSNQFIANEQSFSKNNINDPTSQQNGSQVRNNTPYEMITDDNNNARSYSIYPNPFDDVINVAYESKTAGNIYITIRDVYGKEIQRESRAMHIGSNTTELQLKAVIPAGIYFLSITNDEGEVESFKLLHH